MASTTVYAVESTNATDFTSDKLSGMEMPGFPTKQEYFSEMETLIEQQRVSTDKFLPTKKYLDAIEYALKHPGKGLAKVLTNFFGIREKDAASFIHWTKRFNIVPDSIELQPWMSRISKIGEGISITAREQSYEILTSCHTDKHYGMNMTFELVQQRSASITKGVVSRFVAICPTCKARVEASKAAYRKRDPKAPKNGAARRQKKEEARNGNRGGVIGRQAGSHQQQQIQLPLDKQNGFMVENSQFQFPAVQEQNGRQFQFGQYQNQVFAADNRQQDAFVGQPEIGQQPLSYANNQSQIGGYFGQLQNPGMNYGLGQQPSSPVLDEDYFDRLQNPGMNYGHVQQPPAAAFHEPSWIIPPQNAAVNDNYKQPPPAAVPEKMKSEDFSFEKLLAEDVLEENGSYCFNQPPPAAVPAENESSHEPEPSQYTDGQRLMGDEMPLDAEDIDFMFLLMEENRRMDAEREGM